MCGCSSLLSLTVFLLSSLHLLLEMSTGTGKTIALLSLITSYVLSKPHSPLKLLYCTRTVHEMEKTLVELRSIFSMITSFATSAPLPRSSPSASRPGRIYALTRGFSPLRIVTPWTPMPEADRVVGSGGGHGESQRADVWVLCFFQYCGITKKGLQLKINLKI